jgi:DNA-binding protein H-NS
MGLADRLKGLTKKAEESVVENRDQIQQAVGKAGAAVDSRTGGKYHEQIQKAEVKTGEMIDKLEPAETAPAVDPPQPGSTTAP